MPHENHEKGKEPERVESVKFFPDWHAAKIVEIFSVSISGFKICNQNCLKWGMNLSYIMFIIYKNYKS